jgi:serine protease Do
MNIAKIRNLSLTLVLILSLVIATGCTLVTDEESPSQDSPAVTENKTTVEDKTVADTEVTDTDWTVPVDGQAQMLPDIADVVALVKPSVVSINIEVVIRDIFNRERTSEGEGSGWIISEDGYIVTNNHVVEGANSITVILDDGRSFSAEIVGNDSVTDLAVIKIEAENLPVAKVGDSSTLRIGDWVVAIGNSLGQGTRATAGIVSRQDASIEVDVGQPLYGLIETDAAINPGNSGGPLVNMAGEVIGITNAKLASVEIESVGYAISTETATSVIQDLINTGHAIHPWLGVSLYTVDDYVGDTLKLSVDKGAFIVEAVSGSPATKAGLQANDVIVSFAGRKIETVEDLIGGIRSAEVGQEVEIVYWRGAVQSATYATLIERPGNP